MSNDGDSFKITRSKNFTNEEILALIQVWGDDSIQHKFEHSYRHSVIWDTIANLLKSRGYIRSKEEWKTKIGNLKCQYFKLKKTSKPELIDWPYWNVMEGIYNRKDDNSSEFLNNTLENKSEELQYENTKSNSDAEIIIPDCSVECADQIETKYFVDQSNKDQIPGFVGSDFSCTISNTEKVSNLKRKREEEIDPIINRILRIEEDRLNILKRRTDEECKMFEAATEYFKCLTRHFSSTENIPSSHTPSSFMANIFPSLSALQLPAFSSVMVPFRCSSSQTSCCSANTNTPPSSSKIETDKN
ncbi:uncharacterized protein LOC111632373 isoform X1 [Centruroides sculpturatus]|uniref:uncharacterized protein LOC111632373 isoform X1 n=2 Tax=Centruroides sculpturatus TaxID=218467 RepID=UPI000C6EEF37|nr:uncharacterized protein LOC111632373 isoform X1 [Centruroides sculpturatus]